MTAPEPLTLVELVRHLGEHDYWLGYDSSGMYIAMPVDGNSPAACGTGSTPWEAANEAMPERQVAPRDEAAELRAAVKLYLARLDDYEADQYPRGSIALLKKNEALKALRAALAAFEGQP